MTSPTTPQFPNARRGSVLILVVALLVLLALIGTAFITTTGADRLSSAQNQSNTQVDLLIDGVLNMAIQQTVQKVGAADVPGAAGQPSYRPAVVSLPGTPYPGVVANNPQPQHFSNVDYVRWDPYLANRTPELGPGNVPAWVQISASPLARNRESSQPNIFRGMFASPMVTPVAQPAPSGGSATMTATWHTRGAVLPTSVSYIGTDGTRHTYPALQIVDQEVQLYAGTDAATVNQTMQKLVLAADTDGDGIADAGLFELPMGQVNGVKYYGAVRIVDNAAAINGAIAWVPITDATMPGGERDRLPINVFPTNIDFYNLLTTTDRNNFARYNQWRHNVTSVDGSPSLTPQLESGTAQFQYATRFDASWSILGNRLSNPGLSSGGNRARSLGVGEQAILARRGGLVETSGSQSRLEQYFATALRGGALSRDLPFAPDQASAWFNGIYNYDGFVAANQAAPLRPILTAVSPRSNHTPAFLGNPSANLETPTGVNPPPTQERQRAGKYRYRGDWNGAQLYRVGEWVRFNGRAYVCISANTGFQPAPANFGTQPVPANQASLIRWAEVPWFHHPVAINPNTASFGQMMAAYHAVMGDGPEVRTPGVSTEGSYGGTAGQIFTFGNVLRSNGGAALLPAQVKQLRAAIAAINTIDIRDGDDDVSSRTVVLTDENGGNARTVHVYGTERQPYITSCTVNIDEDDRPYVILELYNPYPVPITLDPYALVWRMRNGPSMFTEIGRLNGQVIQPFGFLKVESAVAQRPPDIAGMPGIDTPVQPLQMPLLNDLVERASGVGELLLLRTRQANGTPTSSTLASNVFNENGNYLDWIPADVLEFTGIATGLDNTISIGTPPMPRRFTTRYHYRRATANNPADFTNHWHCVYAGPYDRTVAAGATERPMRGWVRDPRPQTPMPDPATSPFNYNGVLSLPGFGDKNRGLDGIAHNFGTYEPTRGTYRTRSLQHANLGFGGPYKPLGITNESIFQNPPGVNSAGRPAPAFPVGGFARNGDLLQVTFVGAYRIDPQAGGALAEMNSTSVDAAFAEDGDKLDDDEANGTGTGAPREQLGRFAPLSRFIGGNNINDLEGGAAVTDPGTLDPQTPRATHRYAWATDLFDYFSVICPQDDYLPNVDMNVDQFGADPTVDGGRVNLPKWPQQPAGSPNGNGYVAPEAVPNGPGALTVAGATARDGREDTAPIHGQINVNTANWFVLSTVPWTDNLTTNRAIAKAIVQHRDQNGPFRNLFDLMKVSVAGGNFADALGVTSTLNPTVAQGDITPLAVNLQGAYAGSADDGVIGDFEARYLMITRVSNLISFRSDGFTAYVIVQGWRNAGSRTPELVVQRRAAVVIDRSTVRPIIPTGNAWSTSVQLTPPTVTNIAQN